MRSEVPVRLGLVCSKIGSGATPRGGKDAYRGGTTALIRSQNVHNGRFVRDGLVFIDDVQADELSNVVVESGDVLLNITGDSVARCCRVDPAVLPARVNQHVAIIRPRSDVLDATFLHYVLVSRQMQAHLLALASAGATRNALTKGMIEALEIAVPSIADQRSIGRVLEVLDEKIELNRSLNRTLEAMARALFKSWFVDFDPVRAKAEGRAPTGVDVATANLFPSEFTNSSLGLIPKGWRAMRLGDVLELKRGYDLPLSQRRPGRIPIISSSGLSGRHHESKLQGPGLVTGRYGTIGQVFLVEEPYWPLNTALYVCDFKGTELQFAYHLLSGIDFTKFSDKGAVPGVNRNDLHEEIVLQPPIELQRRFGEVVGLWSAQSRSLKSQSETLGSLRDAMLPKLLSGEMDVSRLEQTVEEGVS